MASLLILVAGPYRSGTDDDPALVARNMRVMNEAALSLFRRGHLPMTGEAIALPLIETAGSAGIGDAVFDEIFHPIAEIGRASCRERVEISVGAVAVETKHEK